MRLRLVAVSGIGTLVVDLHHHARTHRAPIGGKPVALGRYVPALAAAFADSGDYAGGAAVDGVVAEVCAAGVGEVVGGGETGAAESPSQCQYCLAGGGILKRRGFPQSKHSRCIT